MKLAKDIPLEFYKHFEAWVRLEPRCRSNDFSRGLEARTADPLWMLARQWQTGEFWGEDAGSPLAVHLKHSTQPLDRVRLGQSGQVEDLAEAPLEVLVEREEFPLEWRARVQIGQQFERFARARLGNDASELIEDYRTKFSLDVPPLEQWRNIDRATRRFIEFMSGRVIDGQKLLDAKEVESADDRLKPIFDDLKDWHERLYSQPAAGKPEAWRNQQLDYRFEVASSADSQQSATATRLLAPDYRNGALDWYTFDVASGLGDEQGSWIAQAESITHPTRISVAGALPRWWAFEDANVDFGRLDVAKPDLAKLLLMEFVLIYGDDWFSVPLPVQIGSLVRIDEIYVKNVFGEALPRESTRSATGDPDGPLLRWELFTLSPQADLSGGASEASNDKVADVLLIPPVAGFREESPPLEEIRFLRDEGANKVWGVEHIVQNGLGRPVDGFDAQRERIEREREAEIARLADELGELERQLAEDDLPDSERETLQAKVEEKQERLTRLREGPRFSGEGAPSYRLATTVPENWIPFVPAKASYIAELPPSGMRLWRAQMLRSEAAEEPQPIPAMTRLLDLSEEPLLWLEEATVPRSGLRAQLTAQRVRWVDGKTYVWLGRKVLTGRGEGSSGLVFDRVETKPADRSE